MPDIEALRALTPGCSQRTHLNNAGAALMSTPTITAMTDYLHREALIGGYEAEDEAAERIAAVYDSLATLLGALPTQIALFDNSTHAWNAAFYSVPRCGKRSGSGSTGSVPAARPSDHDYAPGLHRSTVSRCTIWAASSVRSSPREWPAWTVALLPMRPTASTSRQLSGLP
jgi:hypothetical protein